MSVSFFSSLLFLGGEGRETRRDERKLILIVLVFFQRVPPTSAYLVFFHTQERWPPSASYRLASRQPHALDRFAIDGAEGGEEVVDFGGQEMLRHEGRSDFRELGGQEGWMESCGRWLGRGREGRGRGLGSSLVRRRSDDGLSCRVD